ncbi:glycosyltransferase family 4 protein [Candidatus Parcubacteria bacterium]|nr:glycosyltransferase family 4 protein [Candidatus Parcubacteria bacterium]
MTIGIILHPYSERHPAGLGRYIFELTKHMVEADSKNSYIIFTKGKKSVDFKGSNWKLSECPNGLFWLDRGLSRGPKADVYIFNTPIMPLFFKPKRSIVIALDYAYWIQAAKSFREWISKYVLYWYNKISLKRADKIVSISEATKKDTEKFFGIPAEKITVSYPGFNDFSKLPEEKINVPEKFFLYVGVLKERKNLIRIVQAFIEFYNLRKDFYLVVVGKTGGAYFEAVKKIVEASDAKNNIIFLGFISDNGVAYLYKHAAALVFPSLIEGFGFPIVEAAACGLPTITSITTSLAEVGDICKSILVDPYNIMAIRDAMLKTVAVATRFFSWDKSAYEMIAVAEKLK